MNNDMTDGDRLKAAANELASWLDSLHGDDQMAALIATAVTLQEAFKAADAADGVSQQ